MRDNPFAAKFPDLRPGEMPSLGSVNGIGTTLVGRRDFDAETGTYVTTQVFSIVFIPIVALSAFRVADAAGGGWHCLGRVPLSRFAKGCNIFLVLAVVLGITAIWWNSHTKSPEYLATRKLEEADKAAAAGQGGQAAKLCREVMDSKTSKSEAAKNKLAGFIAEPPGASSEAAAVYTVAVDLQRENRCPVPDLFEKGKGLANRYAESDPAAALALLEVITPFAPDPAAELTLRGDLLEKILAKNPDDPQAAARLAVVYEARGDRERCEKLLTPFEKRLGSTDGAAVLGRIFASRGEYDRAYALLRPYVNAKLPAYRAAEQALRSQIEALEKRVLESLKSGNAPGFDYARAKSLPQAKQNDLVNDYFTEQIKNDPAIRAAQKQVMAERAVVGATLDLGLVQLQRGQAMLEPDARKAELEAAEKTFLSIRGIAGESAQYRLTLGQVYYWLGRQAEGKKLFDEMLAGNPSAETVLEVANTLREVGDTSESRRLVEDAYNKETDAVKKQQLARFRALVLKDLDDEILWLGRSNTEEPHTQASLESARGQKAVLDGKDDEAAGHFRQAIAIYDRLPVTTSSLNNSSLSHFALFRVTYDKAEFTRALDKLDRAIALQSTDSILLSNGATSAMNGATLDVIGNAVDLRLLKSSGGWDVLPYLYRGPIEQAALFDRLRKHPGAVKAQGYYEKLLTLAPKRTESYSALTGLYDRTRDVAALKGMLVRAENADLDLVDDARRVKDNLAGKDDAKHLEDARKALVRAQAALTAAKGRKDRTLAVAVGRYVSAKFLLSTLGEQVDADELVKLAEEAHAASPSDGTGTILHSALMFRAHLTLVRISPDYAKMEAKTRRSLGQRLPYYVLSSDSPLRVAVSANADVKRVSALELDDFNLNPDGAGPVAVLLIRVGSPAATEAVAAKAKANERLRLRSQIHHILSPYSVESALDVYWQLQLEGKNDEAKKVLIDLAAKGIPVP